MIACTHVAIAAMVLIAFLAASQTAAAQAAADAPIVSPTVAPPATPPPTPSIDIAAARRAIADATRLCTADAGRLWGASLCGPVLLVDPATRDAVASRTATTFAEHEGVFVGRVPDTLTVANTALDWNGTRWIVLLWPLPDDHAARGRLLMHESWHRVQDSLGLPASNPSVALLDSKDGRIRLRLEWRALAAALRARDEASLKRAVHDALAFRTWRRALGADEAHDENALELNEGLAEYTGRRLGGEADPTSDLVADLADAENADSFVRSFAYHSGPAYGLLLDRAKPDWRTHLDAHADLGALLGTALGLLPTRDIGPAPRAAAGSYGGRDIETEEAARETAHRERLARLRAKLIDGAVLVLPFSDMHIEFNPNTLIALPPNGTVYPRLRIRDRWGTLDVDGGDALIDDAWSGVRVAAPKSSTPRGSTIAGDGWRLALSHGWKMVHGTREGDWQIAAD
jgi:hypothetical protein